MTRASGWRCLHALRLARTGRAPITCGSTPTATAPRLFFGEIEEGERERSPGRLNEIATPHIRIVDTQGRRTACVTKHLNDHIACQGVLLRGGDSVVADEMGYPVQNWRRQGIGVVKPMFYARLLPPVDGIAPAATPVLTLDIVPTGRPQEFAVTLRGTPLADANVRLLAPGGWIREQRSDTQGTVRFPFPWPGLYVLHAVHLEPAVGTFNAVAFEGIRHRATLSLQKSGMEPGTLRSPLMGTEAVPSTLLDGERP